MYKVILIVLVSLGFFSCEKNITIPLPDEPVRPTLNAFMNQDSVIVARVTLSGRDDYFDGSSNLQQPDGAVVKLYENDVYIETLHDTIPDNDYDTLKLYKSYAKVTAGKNYRITLEIPGYETAEGTNLIPNRTDLTVSNKTMFYTPTEYGYENNNFRFTITNTGTNKCSYRFRMRTSDSSYYVDENGDTMIYYSTYKNMIAIQTQSNDLSIFDGGYIDPYMGGVYSIQPLNPGESKIYTLVAENVSNYQSYFLEVSALTDDSYNYLYSLNNVLKNGDNPTAEKQNVICNVKNGFGIVGGMVITEVEFR